MYEYTYVCVGSKVGLSTVEWAKLNIVLEIVMCQCHNISHKITVGIHAVMII